MSTDPSYDHITLDQDYRELLSDLTAVFDSGKTKDLAWRRSQMIAIETMMRDQEAEIFAALKSDPYAIEKIAREKLNLAKLGDKIYRIVSTQNKFSPTK